MSLPSIVIESVFSNLASQTTLNMGSKPAPAKDSSMQLPSVIVVKNYFPTESVPNTLPLMVDDMVYVLNSSNPYWWDGMTIDPIGNITRGWFSPTYTNAFSSEKASPSLSSSSILKQEYQHHTNNTSAPSLGSSPVAINSTQRDKDLHQRDKPLFKDQSKDLQKNIFSKLDKDTEKLSSSPISVGSLSQSRRQSLRPRHQSYSKSPSHTHQFHNKSHVLPKSSSGQLNKHTSIAGADGNSSTTQSLISTIKNDSLSTTANFANNNIFKEKNYFTTKQHDSITSANSQFLPLVDSRQSSQAFTEATVSSFHLVSTEEIQSYFEPSRSESQPSFGFVPIWIPQFGENYDVIYKNQALNIFTDEPPFMHAEFMSNKLLYESPDTSNLLNDLNPLPVTLKRIESDASINLNDKYSTVNMLKTNSSANISSNVNPRNLSNQFHNLYNLPSFFTSRPTEVFYTDNNDFLTWDALVSSFINSIDQCILFLKSHDKFNFKEALNDASNTMASYHIAGRLIHQEVVDSKKLTKLALILKKITNMFIQFRIWSTLAIISVDGLESFRKNKELKFQSKEVTQTTINKYIEDSMVYRSKLNKLSSHLLILISQMSITTPNGATKKNSSKFLPMLYSRFVRDKYEGGNFYNKFVHYKSTHADFFIDPNRNKINILLDDEVLAGLKSSEGKIADHFKDLKSILAAKVPSEITLKKFLDDRNLSLLTVVYRTIPLLSSFINIVESIDLTVFAMIDKLAVKQLPDHKTNDTLVGQNVNNNTIKPDGNNADNKFNNDKADNDKTDNTSDNDKPKNEQSDIENFKILDPNIHDPYRLAYPNFRNNTANDNLNDNLENNSQSFYDATAKVFRPMIQDFMHLKQAIHSAFADLILDAQTVTADDPETFFSINREKPKAGRTTKIQMVSNAVIKKLQDMDAQLFNDGIYILEPTLKLLETIKITKERIKLIYLAISQLNDERRSILNYCSRLMNSDFNIASLFIAERHNTLVSKISRTTQSGKSSTTINPHAMNENFLNDEKANMYEELSPKIPEAAESYYDNMTLNYPHIPWYINTDHDEENLIFDGTILKGGTIRGLVAKLVNPLNIYDEMFEVTFLCFFSTFVRPVRLFEILIEKFHIGMPEALSYEEYNYWIDQKLRPQQDKILEIFEKLFSKYWMVDYSSPELIEVWENFIHDIQLPNQNLKTISRKALAIDNQDEYIDTFKLGNTESKIIPMTSVSGSLLHIRMQYINVNYVAEQLTALQAFYYRKINLWDLLGRSYNFSRILHKGDNNKESINVKNISIFIKNCNNLTHFTSYMILMNKDRDERIATIKYFIALAEKLLSLKNYSTMTAIISGLASTGISRLHKTWDGVPQVYISKFQKMDHLMSIGKNYSEYRNILKFVENDDEAYLPFLGMYLSDLRFTTDGNPDWLTSKRGSKGFVNFSKRVSIMKIIKEVMNFNETLYKIKLDIDFSRYMHEMFGRSPDDEKMYELSIKLEPRVSILKNSKGISTLATTSSSIANTDTADLNTAPAGGSVSTTGSSQSGSGGGDNNNAIASSNVGTDMPKKSKQRKNKRYRPLLSITGDKDGEKGKGKSRDPVKDEKDGNDETDRNVRNAKKGEKRGKYDRNEKDEMEVNNIFDEIDS